VGCINVRILLIQVLRTGVIELGMYSLWNQPTHRTGQGAPTHPEGEVESVEIGKAWCVERI